MPTMFFYFYCLFNNFALRVIIKDTREISEQLYWKLYHKLWTSSCLLTGIYLKLVNKPVFTFQKENFPTRQNDLEWSFEIINSTGEHVLIPGLRLILTWYLRNVHHKNLLFQYLYSYKIVWTIIPFNKSELMKTLSPINIIQHNYEN